MGDRSRSRDSGRSEVSRVSFRSSRTTRSDRSGRRGTKEDKAAERRMRELQNQVSDMAKNMDVMRTNFKLAEEDLKRQLVQAGAPVSEESFLDWQVVKAGKKPQTNDMTNEGQGNTIITNNIYEGLEVEPVNEIEMEGEDDDCQIVQTEAEVYQRPYERKKLTQNYEGKDKWTDGRKSPVVEREKTPRVEIPTERKIPFVFKKVNTKDLVTELEKRNIKPDIFEKNNKIKVWYPEKNKMEFLDIVADLKAQGHTYMASGDRINAVILSGIHNTFNIEDVKEDIMRQLGNPIFEEDEDFVVERLRTYYSKTNNVRLGKLVIKSRSEQTINEIKGINSILYSRISWEDMKKQDVTQCHNCLQFGHSVAGGCHNLRQCKACPEKGMGHKCKITKREGTINGRKENIYADYFCVNCQEKGHPATWTGCKARLKLLTIIEANRIRRAQDKINNGMKIDAPLPRTNAWVERTKEIEREAREKLTTEEKRPKTKESKTVRKEKSVEDFFDEVEAELGISYDEMQEITENFIRTYKQLKTKAEKLKAYSGYFLKINKWRQ